MGAIATKHRQHNADNSDRFSLKAKLPAIADIIPSLKGDSSETIIPFPTYPPKASHFPILDKFFSQHPPYIAPGISVLTLEKGQGVEPLISLERMEFIKRWLFAKSFARSENGEREIENKFWQALASNQKSLPLLNLLPQHVQEITGKIPEGYFANCRNAVMKWFSPYVKFDATDQYEFREYLCEYFDPLEPGTPLQPKDVILWRGKNQFTSWTDHAAIYLANNLIWHKLGFGRSPWCIEAFENSPNLFLPEEGEDKLNEYYMKAYRLKPDAARVWQHDMEYLKN